MGGVGAIPLVSGSTGELVRVINILGGHGLASRLEALGIRPGTNIIKRSEMFMRGPVTVEVYGAQIAIGYGMASKILVVPVDEEPGNKEPGKRPPGTKQPGGRHSGGNEGMPRSDKA